MNDSSQDLIPFNCNKSYDSQVQILLYLVQVSYLVPGAILNILILKTILITHSKFYKANSFYTIFSMDCFVSIFLIIFDISYSRLFLYISPLCDTVGPYFYENRIITKIYYVSTNYGRAMKPVIQSFISFNRMTCVIFPTVYLKFWNKFLKIAVLLVFLLPILVIWNVVISRTYSFSIYGGFGTTYIKAVKWASLSLFQLACYSIGLVLTIVFTSITLYGLLVLENRLKSTEKMLTLFTMITSIGFFGTAGFQVFFAFCRKCFNDDLGYVLQFLSFDFLNICYPLVMLGISPALRSHMLGRKDDSTKVLRVSTASHSKANDAH